MAKIENTGQLRAFLAASLEQLRSGKLEPDTVRTMTKVASQINENFYAEIKIARIMAEAGNEVSEFGRLPIGDGGDE